LNPDYISARRALAMARQVLYQQQQRSPQEEEIRREDPEPEIRKIEQIVLRGEMPPSFDELADLGNTAKTHGKASFDAPAIVEALFRYCRTTQDFEQLIEQVNIYFDVSNEWEQLTFVGPNEEAYTTSELGKIEEIREILMQKKELFVEMIQGVQAQLAQRGLLGVEAIEVEAVREISEAEANQRFVEIYS